jgi:hypothetical protein
MALLSKNGKDGIWRMPGSRAENRTAFDEAEVIGPPYRVKSGDGTLTADEIVFWTLIPVLIRQRFAPMELL